MVLLLMSLAVHIATFARINVEEPFPLVYLIPLGIFAVALFLFFAERDSSTPNSTSIVFFTVGVPGWMKIVYLIIAVYVSINLLLSVIIVEGEAVNENGIYVLQYGGKFIRELTKQEYDQLTARALNGYSGLWLTFYLMAAATSFFAIRRHRR